MACLQRISPAHPYVAGWMALGGHAMFVGHRDSPQGGQYLRATANEGEAAGFPSEELAEAAAKSAGFDGPWMTYEEFRRQLRLL